MPHVSAARDEFLAWASAAAVPLVTTEPGSGVEDLLPLLPRLADARLVGLGEATHGTREFFQLKHRLLELLIDRAGAERFLIEASLAESLEVDRHVRFGQPAVDAAVAGMRFWVWDTEEVHALVADLRRRRLRSGTDLRFLGFDAQFSPVAARRVRDLLLQRGQQVPRGLHLLADEASADAFRRLEPRLQDQAAKAVADLPTDLPEEEGWCAAALSAWLEMQAADIWDIRRARDRQMAALAMQLMGEGAGPAVVWAHDQHIGRDGFAHVTQASAPLLSMGGHLTRALGPFYVAVRFSFGAGGFSAVGADGLLTDQWIDAPAPDTLDAALDEVPHEMFALDLATAPPAWLELQPATKLIGSGFSGDTALYHAAQNPLEQCDLLIHVRRTTASRRCRATRRSAPPRRPPVLAQVAPLRDWVLEDPRDVGAPTATPVAHGGMLITASDRWPQRRGRLMASVDATAWRGRKVAFRAVVASPAPSDASAARLLLHVTGPTLLSAVSDIPDPDGAPTVLVAGIDVPADAETLTLEVSAAGPCPVLVRDVELL